MLPKLARLLPLAALLASPAFAQVSLKSIGDVCLESPLEDCAVTSAGFVAPYGATRLAWQVQGGVDEYGGMAAGVVVLAEQEGAWVELAADYSGAYYQLPRLSEGELTLFHVPGFTAGTGAFNADLLFKLEEDGATWTRIDMDAWLVGVELPEDLEIWKGVAFDFSSPWSGYIARSGLWRPDDGNCCPSGGSAVIHLDIEGNRLVGKQVDYTPPDEG